jgi:phospholipase/lecithinase/hemolysin
MKLRKIGSAFLATALVSGCGGNFKPAAPLFTNMVTFGDSLSDVGTYQVGEVAALGGGKFTINASGNKIWVEDIATALTLPAPCAAETGLDGSAAYGFSVPVTTHSGCYDFAQGGSRVTNPVGPGNALLGGTNAISGFLTVPVDTQIQTYLTANNGAFTGHELVTVWAGANDLFINLSELSGGLETPNQAVAALEQAAGEEAAYINQAILANGANYVLVMNLPDVSLTPFAIAQGSANQAEIQQLTIVYNTALKASLAGVPASKVLYFDTFTASQGEAANATAYGLTNITTPACNLAPAANPLGSSLICSNANLSGANVLNYEYADEVHPTPYAHALLSKGVLSAMQAQGWY